MRFLLSSHARKEFESLVEVPQNRKIYASTSVAQGASVVSVCRDDDGAWQFFSAADRSGPQGPVLLHFEHIPDREQLCAEVPPLRKGHWALLNEDDRTWRVVKGD